MNININDIHKENITDMFVNKSKHDYNDRKKRSHKSNDFPKEKNPSRAQRKREAMINEK